jgi:signal transduction histidine kinase
VVLTAADVLSRARRLQPVPRLFVLAGLAFVVAGTLQAWRTGPGRPPLALLDFLFVAGPGAALAYAGLWLQRSDVPARYHRRVVGWVVGGVAVMYGFIGLRDVHPEVTVEWTLGTQAIAVTLGCVVGLLVGVEAARVRLRTDQLEATTRRLRENERELERKNERLEEFAGVVSHDLRNPLNVAGGYLALAREERDSGHLASVAAAHDRMEAMITDLLALARQGESIDDTEPVDVAATAEACWESVATGPATLSVGAVPALVADRDRLRQLLENLMRNAVEHGSTDPSSQARGDAVEHGSTTPPPGDQEDAAADGGDGALTVTVGALDDGAGFYVADGGPGIPAGERERVFEDGYSTNDDGTGLGLAIVREVAEAHGWTVSLTEGDAGGARFEVTGVSLA